jgi:hypothetical protein
MNGPSMEKVFKFTFVLGVLIYSIFVVGIFLLIMKIVLLFNSPVTLLGITLTQ